MSETKRKLQKVAAIEKGMRQVRIHNDKMYECLKRLEVIESLINERIGTAAVSDQILEDKEFYETDYNKNRSHLKIELEGIIKNLG